MKLRYITRTNLHANSAQAMQIKAMAQVFRDQLGCEFELHAPGPALWSYHKPVKWVAPPSLRYLLACLRAAHLILSDRSIMVMTRDIAVALVVRLLNGHVVYEAHKQPIGKIPVKIFRGLQWFSAGFGLICISQALADFYQREYGFTSDQTLVAHSGVFAEPYRALRETGKAELRSRLMLPERSLLIVHSGSLYKGGAELFGELAATDPKLLFVHLGGSAKECARWSAHYQALGVQNVRFMPHQPSETVRAYQVAADLLFYVSTRNSPIYWCTSPLKLFEYMASGTPILGTNLGSVAEVLNDETGFCFNPDDVQSLRDAFRCFLNEPEEAARRTEIALQQVRQYYSWQGRAQRILEFVAKMRQHHGQ